MGDLLWRVAGVLLLLGLAGCGTEAAPTAAAGASTSPSASPAQVGSPAAGDPCQQFGLDPVRGYVGLELDEADALAARQSWREVRRIGVPGTTGQALATNSDPLRLNLVFDEAGQVSSACAG